jgi:hypothetical protein
MLFNGEPQADASELHHTTLATLQRSVTSRRLRAGNGAGTALKKLPRRSCEPCVHGNLCMGLQVQRSKDFAAGLGGQTFRREMQQWKPS